MGKESMKIFSLECNVTFHFSGSHLGAVWFRFILFLPCAYGRFLPAAGGETKSERKKGGWCPQGRELIPNLRFWRKVLRFDRQTVILKNRNCVSWVLERGHFFPNPNNALLKGNVSEFPCMCVKFDLSPKKVLS